MHVTMRGFQLHYLHTGGNPLRVRSSSSARAPRRHCSSVANGRQQLCRPTGACKLTMRAPRRLIGRPRLGRAARQRQQAADHCGTSIPAFQPPLTSFGPHSRRQRSGAPRFCIYLVPAVSSAGRRMTNPLTCLPRLANCQPVLPCRVPIHRNVPTFPLPTPTTHRLAVAMQSLPDFFCPTYTPRVLCINLLNVHAARPLCRSVDRCVSREF